MASSEYRVEWVCLLLSVWGRCWWDVQTSQGTAENLAYTVHFSKRHYLSIVDQSQGERIPNMTRKSRNPTKSPFYLLIKVIVTVMSLYSLSFHLRHKIRYHYGCTQECDIQIYFDVSLLLLLSFYFANHRSIFHLLCQAFKALL